MKAIEMFAGIGGFRLGLQTLSGTEFVWANDIDPLACSVYESNFGRDSIVCKDIREVEESVPEHDLLSAGFPCQPFSQAGKKLGTSDLRGTLFESIARVLRKQRPPFFILENVKRLLTMDGGIHFKVILSELCRDGYWVEWRLLNAKNFGLAQNRERVILVGIAAPQHASLVEAIERNSVLLTDTDLPSLNIGNAKQFTDALVPLDGYMGFQNWGIAYENKVFSHTVPAMLPQCASVLLKEVLEPNVDISFDMTEKTLEWLHRNTPVNNFIHGVEILSNQEGGRRMGYTIFGDRGIAPTVTSTTSRHYERYFINGRYRRLTNVEYARLQGFPDDWCRIAKVYDQYALYGNAIPPNMVAWVVSRMTGNNLRQNELTPNLLFAL